MADQSIMNEVAQLRSQNVDNDEIAQKLLYKGYSNADVFDAMSQSDVSPASETPRMQPAPPQPPAPATHAMQPVSKSASTEHVDSDQISEIAESIIEEKWSDLVDHINKIIEWKSSVELKVNTLEEQLKGLKSEFGTLNKAILGKIGDTDAVMREVSTDIKALEQVFKKILPGFVENVNELSRITSRLKKK